MIRQLNRTVNDIGIDMAVKAEYTPMNFVSNWFMIPVGDKLIHYDFSKRPYLEEPYNVDWPYRLMKCGRQVEKSTTVANLLLSDSCLIPFHRSLYVSPTQIQTNQFSNDRIRVTVEYSDLLRAMLNREHVDRITHKAFHTGSEIRLRYAYHNADRIRGISTDMLVIDELQDILQALVPIIEETLFTSQHKRKLYSGTPKSTNNTIEHEWRRSTQNEWLVPCDSCAKFVAIPGGNKKVRFWNILGEQNIGQDGVVCARCGKIINPGHVDCQWVPRNPVPKSSTGENIAVPFEGYHVSQLMHPAVQSDRGWKELLDKYRDDPRDIFFNECLGLSYDSGLRPLTPAQLRANCDPRITMRPDSSYKEDRPLAYWEQWCKSHASYMGIDWGSAENSYTVITIGTYDDAGRFAAFYMQRCVGPESEPDRQIALIESLVHRFQVNRIGADYGGGYVQNFKLVQAFGFDRLCKFQYSGLKGKYLYSSKLGRFEVNRTEVMSDIFNGLKKGTVFRLPNWDEFLSPFADDYMSIFGEYQHLTGGYRYNLSPGTTDDSFHSLIYCFLASDQDRKRPDVFYPRKADKS